MVLTYIYLQIQRFAAVDMVNKLNEYAAHLGYGGAEIFPKQISRANDRDRGTWINLCYWDGDNTERYAISKWQEIKSDAVCKIS